IAPPSYGKSALRLCPPHTLPIARIRLLFGDRPPQATASSYFWLLTCRLVKLWSCNGSGWRRLGVNVLDPVLCFARGALVVIFSRSFPSSTEPFYPHWHVTNRTNRRFGRIP